MLCSGCDAVRFPSAETGQAAAVRQVKSDKTKAPSKSKVEATVAATGNQSETEAVTDEIQFNLLQRINELELRSLKQDQYIAELTGKLSFVLSYLNIDDTDANKDPALKNCIINVAAKSYADILRTNSEKKTSDISRNIHTNRLPSPSFKDAVLSAVYTENQLKANRAKTLIINGLLKSPVCSDKEKITQLLLSEIGVQPEIKFCKRLGEEIDNKIQPLLVVLPTVADAEHVISCAKKLRHSMDVNIRSNVYINENLTKAEARAAYELRCLRRAAAEKRPTETNHDIMSDADEFTTTTNDNQIRSSVNQPDANSSRHTLHNVRIVKNSNYTQSRIADDYADAAIALVPVSGHLSTTDDCPVAQPNRSIAGHKSTARIMEHVEQVLTDASVNGKAEQNITESSGGVPASEM